MSRKASLARLGLSLLVLIGSPPSQAAAGDPLGASFVVASGTALIPDHPATAVGPDGGFVIAWDADDGSGPDIYMRRYAADGSAQGGAFRVNADTAGIQEHPAVAFSPDGSLYVAWNDRSAGTGGVYFRAYRADGTALSGTVPVNDPARTVEDSPQLAADAQGGLAVAWREALPTETSLAPRGCKPARCTTTVSTTSQLRVRRYLDHGRIALPVAILADFATDDSSGPRGSSSQGIELASHRLAFAPDGTATVAWWERKTSPLGVVRDALMRVDLDPAGQVGRARALASLKPGCARHDFAFGYAAGRLATVYLDGQDRKNCVLSLRLQQRFGAGRQRVDTLGGAAPPALAIDAAGDLVASWSGAAGYLAQRYAAGGGALGINFAIEAPLKGASYDSPALSSASGGDFVATAARTHRDGAGTVVAREIVARRYAGP